MPPGGKPLPLLQLGVVITLVWRFAAVCGEADWEPAN
jgi:hypothetical protein